MTIDYIFIKFMKYFRHTERSKNKSVYLPPQIYLPLRPRVNCYLDFAIYHSV